MYDKYQGQFYSKAQNQVAWLTSEYDEALEKYDVLIMPTTAPLGSALPLKNVTIEDYVNESFRYHQNCCPFDMTGRMSSLFLFEFGRLVDQLIMLFKILR